MKFNTELINEMMLNNKNIKSMKKIKIFAVIIAIIAVVMISSCESSVNSNKPSDENLSISLLDYSDGFYFFDTLYRHSFTEFFKDSVTSFLTDNTIIESNIPLEVWVSAGNTFPDRRECVGKVMLGARPLQGYDTSVTNPKFIPDDTYSGSFRKLDTSEYYCNRAAGFIGLRINLHPDTYIGVVYQNNQLQIFGKGQHESQPDDTLILKIIKFSNPSPSYTPKSWKLKLKNVYGLTYSNVLLSSKIEVKYKSGDIYLDTIPGYSQPIMTMLKTDKVNNTTLQPPPDGYFDLITGKNFYPDIGVIIFPMLEPFSEGLNEAGVSQEYQFYELYSQPKFEVYGNTKLNLYRIKGVIKN